MGGQRHATAVLPPGKRRYPLYRRLSGPQGRPGRVRKTLPPPEFDAQTVQPVASRYTDCVTRPHYVYIYIQCKYGREGPRARMYVKWQCIGITTQFFRKGFVISRWLDAEDSSN